MLSSLCLFVIILTSQATAKPDYKYTTCFIGEDYAPNSTYQTNLHTLLSRLTSNTKNDYGFYNSSYGQDSDRIYATGLCRGDVSPDTCRSCLKNSSSVLLKQCPHHKEALAGNDQCMLHYAGADRNIFGYDESQYRVYLWSETNVTDRDQYNYVLTNLLSRLRVKAAASDPHDPNHKFAAGHATGPSSQTIYAAVQCPPDLTVADCNECLVGAFKELPKCCKNRSGGGVIKFSCNFRYENSRFYEPKADALTISGIFGITFGRIAFEWRSFKGIIFRRIIFKRINLCLI